MLTQEELTRFHEHGFLVVKQLASPTDVKQMLRVTLDGLANEIAPLEYEADLRYPGAPTSKQAPGGRTIRRLKQAFSRDFVFTEWMVRPEVLGRIKQIVGDQVICPLAHHNCIMTKHPDYSSATGWHQDVRYWSFTRPELVNAWIALGEETVANGCLKVIPGSHKLAPEPWQLDDQLFFRQDEPRNEPWLKQAVSVPLSAGDVLFFHARTLHSAGRNTTTLTKHSVVFTFRPADNPPVPGSRSAVLPELLLTP